ncbi:methylated-DNA--[protein]-cysteine S-methyltransferase [Virgibacillus sediminis]|uniref:Methylated-DNA--protein-cysteine methyltransferase n=1 Tax=Virgibacillus sediminis TaxID=202260 RepID=A0ABV7A7M2_9BACI
MYTTDKVYIGKLDRPPWSLFIAVTEQGLAFVGSDNGPKSEVESWAARKRPESTLVDDQDRIAPYVSQLEEYLDGERKAFEMPLDLSGTPFQQQVWTALTEIPYGRTAAYSEVAGKIGRPRAVRAVGAAIGANPVMVAVPCHRVIGKNGKMTGYRGGLAMKQKLLELEQG